MDVGCGMWIRNKKKRREKKRREKCERILEKKGGRKRKHWSDGPMNARTDKKYSGKYMWKYTRRAYEIASFSFFFFLLFLLPLFGCFRWLTHFMRILSHCVESTQFIIYPKNCPKFFSPCCFDVSAQSFIFEEAAAQKKKKNNEMCTCDFFFFL